MTKRNYLLNTVLFNLNEVTPELFSNLGGRDELVNAMNLKKSNLEDNQNVVKARLVTELLNLGFILDEEVYNKLEGLTVNEIIVVRERLIELIGLVRGKLEGEVFYPKFPSFVKNLSDRDLVRYQLKHYSTTYGVKNVLEVADKIEALETMFSAQLGEVDIELENYVLDNFVLDTVLEGETFMVSRPYTLEYYFKDEVDGKISEEEFSYNDFLEKVMGYLSENNYKGLLEEYSVKQTISFGELSTALDYVKNVINAKTSINEDMKQTIDVIVELSEEELESILPEDIIRKENMAYVLTQLFKKDGNLEPFKKYIKTTTDVIRVLDSINGGDGSLNTFTYSKLNRPTRRLIMELLNGINPYVASEDMFRQEQVWKGLVRVIHPFEPRFNKYKNSQEAFTIFVKGDKSHTFSSKTSELMKKIVSEGNEEDVSKLVNILKARPGEFSRNIDFLVRATRDNPEMSRKVLEDFSEVIGEVSSLVLHQMNKHFTNYKNSSMTETSIGHFVRKRDPNRLHEFEVFIIQGMVSKELRQRMSQLDELGKVYLDSQLKQVKLPLSLRTSSVQSTHHMTRGSKMALEGKDKIRLFTRWTNHKDGRDDGNYGYGSPGRIDIDLSAMFLKEDFSKFGEIWYGRQRINGLLVTHSGDITDAPKGAFEFIEVDKKDMLEKGIKYVVMSLITFSGGTFKEIEESTAGWVEFNDSDDINMDRDLSATFNKEELRHQFDIVSNSRNNVPLIYDVEKDMVYWVDSYLTNQQSGQRVGDSVESIKKIVEYYANDESSTVYDLLDTHIKNRNGVEVHDKKLADTVFTYDELNLPDILSNYL